ncbi:SDR family oxidoreductase [Candidatus Poriferisocius sp.]|uniref:SDR family oxidoreductase n=1 Tax=Candidatus Poriferisocius sp. TaxID=3101276 RepID=UPI003B5A6C06
MQQSRHSVVSGSASGIGRAVAERLAAEGDRVVGIDRAGADIGSHIATNFAADLATPEGRAAAIAEVLDRCDGAVDRVIAAAGVSGLGTDAATTVSVNYFGTVELFDGLRPAMEGRPNPCAVGIVSNSAVMGVAPDDPAVVAMLDGNEAEARQQAMAGQPFMAYALTKHALARAIRHRAGVWGPLGVRINAIVPGKTDTPLYRAVVDDPAMGKFADRIPVPLGRVGTPEEMAGIVSFLVGDDARYVHGMMLWADGGTDAAVRPDEF